MEQTPSCVENSKVDESWAITATAAANIDNDDDQHNSNDHNFLENGTLSSNETTARWNVSSSSSSLRAARDGRSVVFARRQLFSDRPLERPCCFGQQSFSHQSDLYNMFHIHVAVAQMGMFSRGI
jgi:hypothetical protein